MQKFKEEDLTEDNIYFLDKETDNLFLFSFDENGFIVDKDNNEKKFKWNINEDGFLKIKNRTYNFIWKLKNINQKEKYIIVEEIKKENNDFSKKEKIIHFEYNDKKINKNMKFIFSLLNKKEKKYLILFFISIFLILHIIFNFIFLINSFNFLLKSFFIIIILLLSKDLLTFVFVKHLKKHIKD